jgi:16S rRNA (cytosine967-C5)-methyltransferase
LSDAGTTGTSSRSQGATPRLAAALAVKDVLGGGRALDSALERRLERLVDPRDRGLAGEIAYGVLRFLPRLRALTAPLLRQPFKSRDLDVECLLLGGIYQIRELRVPAHAAVSSSVAAGRLLRKPWAPALLNAVLRNFQRRQDDLLSAAASDPDARHCHPRWLQQALSRSWPDDWEQLVDAGNSRPPMVLRVNLARTARRDYAATLMAAGITARPLEHAPAALVLDQPRDVQVLPGFADGLVSVQDGAAQLAAPLLRAEPGQRVLDACAAPGGKTAHLLESTPDLDLTAVDLEPRLEPLRANLRRLGLNARVVAADLRQPEGPWADRPYDRILLDAPCSATGVIRRHPDIKWLRRADDIPKLAAEQGRILDNLWPRLAPGGILLYATCSLLADENHATVQAFLQRATDAEELPIDAAWGRPCPHGRQVLSSVGGMDGFYFARLRKAGGRG